MTILVAVAVGVPCLGVLAFLGMRRIQSLPFARSLALARSGDMRGIALQTVIIMVVLLAVAGGVAAVLLSTGSEVTGELESQDTGTTIDTADECEAHRMGDEPGEANDPFTTCTWQHDDVSLGSCRIVGGEFTPTTNESVNRDGDPDATDDQCALTV